MRCYFFVVVLIYWEGATFFGLGATFLGGVLPFWAWCYFLGKGDTFFGRGSNFLSEVLYFVKLGVTLLNIMQTLWLQCYVYFL